MKDKCLENENCANIIQKGTLIIGNIETEGNIRIDGTVTGNIKAKGKLIVGNTGYVEGNIECSKAVIEGKIKNSIIVNDLLEMKSSSIIDADIVTSKLSIEAGAVFAGNCKMSLNDKNINNKK